MDNTTGSKHGLRFWHDMVNYGPKKSPKTVTFTDALFFFYISPWDLSTFSAERVPSQTPKKALFHPKSHSKGPKHALANVLTIETPDMHISSEHER